MNETTTQRKARWMRRIPFGSPDEPCPFCLRIHEPTPLPRNEYAIGILDASPRAPGHALIVPVQHVADYFDLPDRAQAALFELAPSVRAWQHRKYQPTGWTLRINVGVSAGQTVPHVHLHILPAYGNVPHDPFKHQERP